MHIGLIGGIGVAATLVYYPRLVSAITERDARPEITIVHAQAQDLVVNNREDLRQEQADLYLPLLERLARAGCDCAAITSLGGHFCFDETVALSPLPLISAVAPIDAYFAAQGIGRIGLLGTKVVMRTRLYSQLQLTQAVAPDDRIEEIGETYIDVALSGKCNQDQRRFFIEAGRSLVKDRGAEAVVLAGTDLGLAFDGQDTGYRVIDALDIHVGLLARLASGEARLEDHAAS